VGGSAVGAQGVRGRFRGSRWEGGPGRAAPTPSIGTRTRPPELRQCESGRYRPRSGRLVPEVLHQEKSHTAQRGAVKGVSSGQIPGLVRAIPITAPFRTGCGPSRRQGRAIQGATDFAISEGRSAASGPETPGSRTGVKKNDRSRRNAVCAPPGTLSEAHSAPEGPIE